MNVTTISLSGFRNYDAFSADFSENVNVILGDNAQGKTNLLESLYFMAAGRSFRAKSDKELINFNASEARILVELHADSRPQKLEARLFRQHRRQFVANGVKLRSGTELCGRLRTVLFCPDDLMMIREGAGSRRRLLDHSLCQLRPRYGAVFSEYTKLLEHKSRILRDHREKPSLLYALDDFNLRLIQTGAELIYYRAAYAALLSEKAAAIHKEFSGDKEDLSIHYKTVKTILNPQQKPTELMPLLQQHLEEHHRAELDSGQCLSGPHKDDLEIMIGGIPARTYASQGQARTAALSIKLAERELHFMDSGEYPLLLLDDVLSELDMSRQSFVLNKIKTGQVFITCCDDAQIVSRTGGRVIHIDGGKLWRSS